jgi:hypothetical protein
MKLYPILLLLFISNAAESQVIENYFPIKKEIVIGQSNNLDTINRTEVCLKKQGIWIIKTSENDYWKGLFIDDLKEGVWCHISTDSKDTFIVEYYTRENLQRREEYVKENGVKYLKTLLKMNSTLDTVKYFEFSIKGEIIFSEIYVYPPKFFPNVRKYFGGIGEEDFFCVYRMKVINRKKYEIINLLR